MRQRIRKRPMSEINVVPYIDVMLVLLIIFMITAPLLTQGIKVDLPEVPSKVVEATDKEPVIINVDAAGNYYINYGENQDKPVAAADLLNRVNALLKYQPGIPVLVGGDQAVPYGRVAQLMSLLQSAGVPSVGMITESPEQ
ncbi:MAG: protein TolR [Gammaproteobacteria bacterium]|nr:protein TolR [Gammaproteobacteria bacterium]NIN61722.1 protein TolR [Gammaproteobacteria bacterium]NIO63519.1 protein TolR [Gammaproteobacteria bacterium]NIP48739.1 protein TolR [Gammaproteobacteria bacterium]NIQ09191.1 protein TolR [Gammaproteobacteria bacterium]